MSGLIRENEKGQFEAVDFEDHVRGMPTREWVDEFFGLRISDRQWELWIAAYRIGRSNAYCEFSGEVNVIHDIGLVRGVELAAESRE